MTALRDRLDRLQHLWRAALAENASPGRFGLSVAIGALLAASAVPPVLGLRTACSVGLAWLARLNRLTAALSVNLVGPPGTVFALLEVRLGCAVLGRPLPHWPESWRAALQQLGDAGLAWWVGSLFIAPPVAALAGLIGYAIARRRMAAP